MLITSTVEICIQQLGRVEEMVFTAWCSYRSAVLGAVIPSVCHTRALWLIQRTYRRYFYTTWKGNPSSQMWFFIQLCSSWQDFNWFKALRGPSAIAELLVAGVLAYANDIVHVVLAPTASAVRHLLLIFYDYVANISCWESLRYLHKWLITCKTYHFVINWQTINILYYSGECQSIAKQKLLFVYCYRLYGCVLCNLNSPHIKSVYTAWHKAMGSGGCH